MEALLFSGSLLPAQFFTVPASTFWNYSAAATGYACGLGSPGSHVIRVISLLSGGKDKDHR